MKKTRLTAILMAVLLVFAAFSQCLAFAAEAGGTAAEAGEAPAVENDEAVLPDDSIAEDAAFQEPETGGSERDADASGTSNLYTDGGGVETASVEEDSFDDGSEQNGRAASETLDTDISDDIDGETPDADVNAEGSVSALRSAEIVTGSEDEGTGTGSEAASGSGAESGTESATGLDINSLVADEDGVVLESQGEEEAILDAAGAGAGAAPVVALPYVPAYGIKQPIQGQVYMEDGSSFNPSDFRISVFLQVDEGGKYWPKPTYEKPYTDIGQDGSFSAVFCTGGEDVYARILHILLIPSDFVPTSFSETMGRAVDYVKIVRAEDGTVTVTPLHEVPPPPGAPAINALLPVKQDRIGVNVGFYTEEGSSPEIPGCTLSESLIREQLARISVFSDIVRFYSAGGEVNKAYKIAHDMGLSVVGTAYLCGNESADKEEMDALIRFCNEGYVQVACVGNETLLETNDRKPMLTAEKLIEDINYVREGITQNKDTIPVTTSDSVGVLLANASVRNACNLVMPNCYPFWEGADISGAADAFIQSVTSLQAVSGGRQVLVAETGWPTDGGRYGNAVAGEAQAAQFFEAVREWSLTSGTQILYFQAFDEPWKTESGFGPNWGFMTNAFSMKSAYAATSFFKQFGYCVHDYATDAAVAPTCTEAGLTAGTHCSICGETIKAQKAVPATGHKWGGWTTVKEPTATEEGKKQRVCENDPAHVETEPIDKMADHPVLALTRTPAIGENAPFEGYAFMKDGSAFFNSGYRVTMYLEEPVNHAYWVKPSAARKFSDIAGDGYFSISYNSGGQADLNRTDFWILLFPADFTDAETTIYGDPNFDVFCKKALDCVHVEKKQDGTITVSPRNQISITRASVAAIPDQTYTGSAKKPSLTVKYGSRTLVSGKDYTVRYSGNTNAGTASVTVSGKGGFSGSVKKTFKINKAGQAFGMKASASKVAIGKTASVTVTGAIGKVTFKSSDTGIASVTSAGKVTAKKAGTVKITATAEGGANHLAASKTVTIKAVPAAVAGFTAKNLADGIRLDWMKADGATGYKLYRNGAIIRNVKITGGTKLTFTDKGAGKNGTKCAYKIVAYASAGDSTLSKTVTVCRLDRPAVTSLKNTAAKKMTVKWNENAAASGYEIQYGTDKAFSGAKTAKVSKKSTVSKVLPAAAKGTWYVRIRAYRILSGSPCYSAWSAAKSVKVTK